MQVFIAGSHTDVGKTSVSAALCYAFNLEYFKFFKIGFPSDVLPIHTLALNGVLKFLPLSSVILPKPLGNLLCLFAFLAILALGTAFNGIPQ